MLKKFIFTTMTVSTFFVSSFISAVQPGDPDLDDDTQHSVKRAANELLASLPKQVDALRDSAGEKKFMLALHASLTQQNDRRDVFQKIADTNYQPDAAASVESKADTEALARGMRINEVQLSVIDAAKQRTHKLLNEAKRDSEQDDLAAFHGRIQAMQNIWSAAWDFMGHLRKQWTDFLATKLSGKTDDLTLVGEIVTQWHKGLVEDSDNCFANARELMQQLPPVKETPGFSLLVDDGGAYGLRNVYDVPLEGWETVNLNSVKFIRN